MFARNGHALVLVARRAERLQALADEIEATGQPAPVVLPSISPSRTPGDRIEEALSARGLEPQFVVNNAGFGLARPGRVARPRRASLT